jgi:hypothetical protein
MCRFIYVDCQGNQRKYGIDAYNRIKHGLAFVPNGSRYLSGLPNAPAVLIESTQPGVNPYALLALPMDDAALRERARAVEFTQATLRAIVSFYLIGNYTEFLRSVRGVFPASSIFRLAPLLSVMEFMEQLSEKSEATPVEAVK